MFRQNNKLRDVKCTENVMFDLYINATATFASSLHDSQDSFLESDSYIESCHTEYIDKVVEIPRFIQFFNDFSTEMCLLDNVITEIEGDKDYLLKLEVRYAAVDGKDSYLNNMLSTYNTNYNFDPHFRDRHSLKTKMYQEISSKIPNYKIDFTDIR